MRKAVLILLLMGVFVIQVHALDGKTIGHIISVPLIDAAGIYSSVKVIGTDEVNGTAAAITNLSLLGINAGLGVWTMLSGDKTYQNTRTLHRILGFAITGASIWLAVSSAVNDDITGFDKGVAAGYSVMTVVPILMFSF